MSLPPLLEALQQYQEYSRKRFHVPAHAGQILDEPVNTIFGVNPYRFDLTELDGLDVLSEPSGCLAKSQEVIASLFQVAHSYFLVNGASVGIMATMLSLLKPGDKVLLPRNVHRSVLNGLILTGAQPIWFLPARLSDWGIWGAVTEESLQKQLKLHPDAKALFLTSPTYEGIGSDIPALACLCDSPGIALVVDEAHGSLWSFSSELPFSATQAPCDAVIHSMHKSGGSLTQSALAHLPVDSRIQPEQFQQALNMLHTTSPSYLLMASLEASVHYLVSQKGQERLKVLNQQVFSLRQQLQQSLKSFALFQPNDSSFWDPHKLYLIHSEASGEDWGELLEKEYGLAYESASPSGVLYLANLGLENADFEFLNRVFQEVDKQFVPSEKNSSLQSSSLLNNSSMIHSEKNPTLPDMVLTPRDAFFAPGRYILSQNSVGCIAKETIVRCPPGIPVLMPGERIQENQLPFLEEKVMVVDESV